MVIDLTTRMPIWTPPYGFFSASYFPSSKSQHSALLKSAPFVISPRHLYIYPIRFSICWSSWFVCNYMEKQVSFLVTGAQSDMIKQLMFAT